jgi:hypothetical protein
VADKRPIDPLGATRKGKVIRPPRIVLATDQSEALRDRLVAELRDLQSADEAADWVHKNLAAKNTLVNADAETVEANFQERLAAIEGRWSAAASEQNKSGDAPLREQSKAFDSPLMPAPETKVVVRRRIAAKTIHILDSIEGLVDHPFRGKPGRSPNTRELGITSYPYLIVYSVERTTTRHRINRSPLTSSACSTALCNGRRRSPRKALKRAVHFRRLPTADAGLACKVPG